MQNYGKGWFDDTTMMMRGPGWSYPVYICVASLQNSPLVGRNESGLIPDWSKKYFFDKNFLLVCLLISMLIHIVLYVPTVVISTYNIFKCDFFLNFVPQVWYFSTIELLKLTYNWLINVVWRHFSGTYKDRS